MSRLIDPRDATIVHPVPPPGAARGSARRARPPLRLVGRPHVAVVVAFGPEVRSLIYSGLIARLAAEHEVTVLAANPASAAFDALPASVRVEPLPGPEAPALSPWRYRVLRLHQAWLERQGRGKWSHAAPRRGAPRAKDRLLGRIATPRAIRLAAFLERAGGRAFGTRPAVAERLRELGIDLVLACSYTSPRVLPLLQTADNLGIPAVIATNSWKDVFVQAHVPVRPARLLLWTASDVAELGARNPFFPAGRAVAVGSLHLAAVGAADVLPRGEFCARFGLDPARPVVCYTAAAPNAVDGEPEVLREMIRSLATLPAAARPQVVVRANPMEDGSRFEPLLAGTPDVVLQRPEWEWDAERDWCCALPGDLRLWASTIAHSAANVSIPSTVTLEFLAAGKPVVNVRYDRVPGLPPERSARRFWEADFYRRIREMSGVHAASGPAELRSLLERASASALPGPRADAKGDPLGLLALSRDASASVLAAVRAVLSGS